MAYAVCVICNSSFYAKPSHINKGWAKYCSKPCQYKSQKSGEIVLCTICGSQTYRNKAAINRSSSGKFFCSKRCQTIWRNSQIYINSRHPNFTTGKSSYRDTLKRSGRKQVCKKCGTTDKRVLAVHHKDKNRENNDISNLLWLCHNCQFLVHNYFDESEGYVVN